MPTVDLDGSARCFQRRLARRSADPWLVSAGADLRYPTTTGVRVTAATRLQHRYLDRVQAAATRDVAIADSFGQVVLMLARPMSLFAPLHQQFAVAWPPAFRIQRAQRGYRGADSPAEPAECVRLG